MTPDIAATIAKTEFLEPVIDTLPSNIAILDTDGRILATNRSWQEFAEANDLQMRPATTGVNYLEIAGVADDADADRAAAGLRAVLRGERERFELEYPCHAPDEKRWFLMRAVPFTHEGTRYATVAHIDITERKQRERESAEMRDRMEFALEATDAIVWDADLLSGDVTFYPSSQSLYDADIDTIDGFLAQVHPDDQRRVEEAIETGYETGTYTVEFRIERDDEVRWIADQGRFERDTTGTPVRGTGVARDITERKERERKYRRLTERISDAYYAFDSDWTVTYWNESVADRTGIPAEEIVGTTFWERYPELENTVYEDTLREAMRSQERKSCEFYDESSNVWLEVQAYPDDEGISVISQDITERKEHERELARQRDRLAQLNRLNRLVREIIQALRDTATREAIETAVCDRLTESDLYQGAWIGVRGTAVTGDRTVIPRTTAGIDASYLDEISDYEGPANMALRTGEVQVVDDIATADEFPDDRREPALSRDYHTLVAIPLTTGETTYGVLTVYLPATYPITGQERATLADLGRILAQAIQRVHSQRALNAETVVTLDLRIPNTDFVFGEVSTEFDCKLSLERRVTIDDGATIHYLTVSDADPKRVCEFLRERSLAADCTVVREDGSRSLIEVHLDDSAGLPSGVISDYGGSVTTAHVAGGDLFLGVELPPAVDVRTVIDALRETAPTVDLVSKQYVDRPMKTTSGLREQITDQLSAKQEAALKAAYTRGYYAWPRDTTMEELADTFDLSASSLHYRLRKAHQTVMSIILDDEDAGGA